MDLTSCFPAVRSCDQSGTQPFERAAECARTIRGRAGAHRSSSPCENRILLLTTGEAIRRLEDRPQPVQFFHRHSRQRYRRKSRTCGLAEGKARSALETERTLQVQLDCRYRRCPPRITIGGHDVVQGQGEGRRAERSRDCISAARVLMHLEQIGVDLSACPPSRALSRGYIVTFTPGMLFVNSRPSRRRSALARRGDRRSHCQPPTSSPGITSPWLAAARSPTPPTSVHRLNSDGIR